MAYRAKGTYKRVTLCLDKRLAQDLDDIARQVGRQRDGFCSKSEIAEIALTAFIVSWAKDHENANDNKED